MGLSRRVVGILLVAASVMICIGALSPWESRFAFGGPSGEIDERVLTGLEVGGPWLLIIGLALAVAGCLYLAGAGGTPLKYVMTCLTVVAVLYVILLFADLGFFQQGGEGAYIPPSHKFGFYLALIGALISVGAAGVSFKVRDSRRM